MILKAVLTGMFDSNCYILGDHGEAAVIDPGADVEDIARILEEHALKLKFIIMTHAHIDHITEVDNLRDAVGGKAVIHEDDAPLLGDRLLNGSALFGRSRTFNKADVLVKDGDVLELGKAKLRVIHTPGHTPGGICILVTGSAEKDSSMGTGTGLNEDVGSGVSTGIGLNENTGSGVGTGIGLNEDVVSGMAEESRTAAVSGQEKSSGMDTGIDARENYLFTGDTLFRLSIGRTDLGAGDQQKIIESIRRLMKLDGSLKVYPGHGPATTIEYERLNNPWI